MKDHELFEYFIQLEKEYSDAFAYNIGTDRWDEKRLAMYAHGPLHGLYRENSQILWKYLKQDVNKEELLDLLKKFIKDSRTSMEEKHKREFGTVKELQGIIEKAKTEEDNKLKYLRKSNIFEWMDGYNALILEELALEPEAVKLRFLELYIEYSYYKKYYDYITKQTEIDKIYASVLRNDSNYRKWGLISIGDSRELLVLDGPRIYDSSVDKTVFLYTPKSVASVIAELNCEKLIGVCSFLGSGIADGRIETEYLQEAVEFGKVFTISLDILPPETKLYSDKYFSYDDQLWIKCENNDLTFEELLSGQEDADVIKTQMVHFQYSKDDDCYYISHLDHEYIFYTKEEYKIRKGSIKQKGQANKRQKTFKIDDSRIPFTYPCKVFRTGESGGLEEFTVPFIYFVINAYFLHKDLLEEYFINILKADTDTSKT